MIFKKISILFVLVALLLSACGPASPLSSESTLPSQSTSTPATLPTTQPPTEPTTQPTTAPTIEPTAQTTTEHAEKQILAPELWQTEPEYLPYEEYFAADPYPHSGNWDGKWLVMEGKTGTAYRISHLNNWDHLEAICQILGGREDTWYATNMEIYDYVTAYNRLFFSADGSMVYNPTLIKVWFDVDGTAYSIEPGQTIKI